MKDSDYKSFQARALEQLKSGKPLLGMDGAFVPLLENLLNAALEGEMDAIHYKVMDDKNRSATRAIYNVLGVDGNGHKDLLGMYISRSESANFWLSVLTDL